MKISIAQIKPIIGKIDKNVEKHQRLIDMAVSYQGDLIFFPELSLTGYEPKLAKELATNQEDSRLDSFQKLSDNNNIIIGVGIPTTENANILISMVIFQPKHPRITYSKQMLHADELPYFTNGNQQIILTVNTKKIAPAICYESLQAEHSETIFKSGVTVYLASVAKSVHGVAKAFKHYPDIARTYSMTVLMSNSVGFCDDFESFGNSAVWNNKGELMGHLDETNEGILIYDTDTEELIKRIFPT